MTTRELEIYGRRLIVEKTADGWQTYVPGSDGKRSPPALLPAFIRTEEELIQYLADLWHESARPDRATIRWIR
ncbi:MAG: DUF7661 family protein [Gemmatimonadaceae bacterium]